MKIRGYRLIKESEYQESLRELTQMIKDRDKHIQRQEAEHQNKITELGVTINQCRDKLKELYTWESIPEHRDKLEHLAYHLQRPPKLTQHNYMLEIPPYLEKLMKIIGEIKRDEHT